MNNWFFIYFLIVVVTVYSLLNYYFIKKHRNFITLQSLPAILFRLLLFTIILTPIATIIFSKHGFPFLASITGFVGYSWLAFLFLFLEIHGIADIILFAIRKVGYSPPQYTLKVIFLLTVFAGISILFYCRFEAQKIQIENITIETDKLLDHIKELTLVQLSDVHFSQIIGVKKAYQIQKLVQRENPDIIVSTGDLLDRGINNPNKITRVLKSLQAPLGKYAVTGNHEFYAGINESIEFTNKAGFKVLRNESVLVGKTINIIGIDDKTGRMLDTSIDNTEKKLLSQINNNYYTIILKHQPRVNEKNIDFFDLQLSGHTHAGQIFPFSFIVKLVFRYIAGLYELGCNTKLYVNRGTGTWGPPFRFLAPPEITVIKLKNIKQ